jgi:hypothetical protein
MTVAKPPGKIITVRVGRHENCLNKPSDSLIFMSGRHMDCRHA